LTSLGSMVEKFGKYSQTGAGIFERKRLTKFLKGHFVYVKLCSELTFEEFGQTGASIFVTVFVIILPLWIAVKGFHMVPAGVLLCCRALQCVEVRCSVCCSM